MITGHSMKAKKKVEIVNPVITKTKNGRFMAKGGCPETDGTVCAFLSDEAAKKAIEDGVATKGY